MTMSTVVIIYNKFLGTYHCRTHGLQNTRNKEKLHKGTVAKVSLLLASDLIVD